MNRKATRDLSYGVYVISAKDGSRDVGCVANSAMQVTSNPSTIAVSINHDNYTNTAIKNSGMFAMSILPESIDQSVIGTFGFKSSRDTDKFASVASVEKSGIKVIAASKSYLTCKVIDKMETETHTVFLGEVIDADILTNETPMTYAYYHNVVKGTSPKNAPTYVEEDAKEAGGFKCTICGYVENLPELPEGYTCPICGVAKSLFEKI